MKRILIVLICMLLLLLPIMSGCNNSGKAPDEGKKVTEDNNAEKGPEENKKKTVKLKLWKSGVEEQEHEYWLNFVKKFDEANDNIEMEYLDAPWTDFQTKLNVAFASGTVPDIVGNSINTMPQLVEKNHYIPLDGYIKNWSNKDEIEDFYINSGVYKGKQYGIGHKATAAIWVYRKDFFENAGLNPEKPPETWEQLAEYASKLTIRENGTVKQAGFNIPVNDDKLFLTFLYQAGGKLIDENSNPAWNSPEALEALNFIKELTIERKVNIEISTTANDKQNLFSAGRAAMAYMYTSWLKTLLKEKPSLSEKIGLMELKNKRQAAFCGCELFFITADSRHHDEAWKLIENAMTEDEVWERYKKTGNPPNITSLKEQFINDDPLLNKGTLNSIENGVHNAKAVWGGLYTMNYGMKMVEEVVYGVKTPEEALKSYYDKFIKEISSFK